MVSAQTYNKSDDATDHRGCSAAPIRDCKHRGAAATPSPISTAGQARTDAAGKARAHAASQASTGHPSDQVSTTRHAKRGDTRRADLSDGAVHHVIRRRTRPAFLSVWCRLAVCRSRHVLPDGTEDARGRVVRDAANAPVRHRSLPRRGHGVSAERDHQGLHVRWVGGLPEPPAWRPTRTLPNRHSDCAGPAGRCIPESMTRALTA